MAQFNEEIVAKISEVHEVLNRHEEKTKALKLEISEIHEQINLLKKADVEVKESYKFDISEKERNWAKDV